MITVRAATTGEVSAVTSDPLAPLSAKKYAAEIDGQLIAYFGVSCASLTSDEGWPWLYPANLNLITRKQLVRITREVMRIWGDEFKTLWLCEKPGVNASWFKFLGFRVDRYEKPVYADGQTMVFMRYTHGRDDSDK